MKQDIENIIKKNLPEKKEDDGFAQDPSVAFNNGFDEALSQINTSFIADEVLKVVVGSYKLGDKINAFGKEFEIVGLSRMIYDKDCEGEPEWKITKEIQEIAIAEIYPDISYQKPSWHKLDELLSSEHLSPNKENENNG